MFLAALLMLQATPQCAAVDANLPAPLAGWTTPGSVLGAGRAIVLPSTAARDPAENGVASVEFGIEKAGAYGIALDQPGWIDVMPRQPGGGFAGPLKSAAHGHGPQCSSIRKIVRFDLKPGRYLISLKKLTRREARLMLVAPD
jgi:hypothetical protein